MRTGILIVGGGVAGLAAALATPPNRPVVVISETPLATGDIASSWAQGGVAAALAPDDSPRLHADDTVAAGAGLNDPAAVETLATEAPAAIEALIQLGVPFARNADGQLALGLEAAHNHRRIAHVADATGAAIVTALTTAARTRPNVHIIEGVRAARLLSDNSGTVTGALLVAPNGEIIVAAADAVILATGGFGGLFARTTTPLGARGSGIALAARAGAALADLEFIQFHPTALRIAADPLPLVSEAVRGEGALLLDQRGERIMDGIDARMELAPRDIVARAVAAVERRGGAVVLDARTTIADRFPQRFPGIFATAMRAGIDPRREPIPITAVAHYTIGGIATDLTGRTTLPGLWAAGEVAATGLHGANRLASNSLVEGLVFGARAGHDAANATITDTRPAACAVPDHAATGDLTAALHPLRTAMTAGLGVVRDAAGITRALDVFTTLERTATDDRVADAAYVATAVARAALARRESRGAHQRTDYPNVDPSYAHRTVSPADRASAQHTFVRAESALASNS